MIRLSIFLILNFGALYVGALLMNGSPAENDWYLSLNKAPWTPPGWVFGVAWTLIMICYSIYMSFLVVNFKGELLKKLLVLYSAHWVLNVSWNWIFFHQHWVLGGAIVLVLLIVVLLLIQNNYAQRKPLYQIMLTPYILWLSIALSMNVFIFIQN